MILSTTLGIAMLWGRPVLWMTARATKPVPVLPTPVVEREAFNKPPVEIQLDQLAYEPIERFSPPTFGADRALDAGASPEAPRLVQTDPPFL